MPRRLPPLPVLITTIWRITPRFLSAKPSRTNGGACGTALAAEQQTAEKATCAVCFDLDLLKLGYSHSPVPKIAGEPYLNEIGPHQFAILGKSRRVEHV